MTDEEALAWLQGKHGYPYADECVTHLATRFERLRAIEVAASAALSAGTDRRMTAWLRLRDLVRGRSS